MEFGSQNIEQYYRMSWAFFNEGISRWIPVAENAERTSDKKAGENRDTVYHGEHIDSITASQHLYSIREQDGNVDHENNEIRQEEQRNCEQGKR